ncbi:MAG: hypothetical protein V8K32_09210 [Candidatus Electrothrix gigas]
MHWQRITLSDFLLYLLLLSGPIAGGLVRAGPKAVAHASIVLLAALSLLTAIQNGRLNLRRTLLDLCLALFSLIAVVSACIAVYPHAARHELFRLAACIALFYFVISTQRRTIKILRLCRFLVISASLHAVLVLLLAQDIDGSSRSFITLFFANHNHLAGYLEMLVCLAFGLATASRGKERFIFFGLGIMLAAAVVFSLSRTGTVALAGGFCFEFALTVKMERRRSKRRVLLVTAFAFLVFTMYVLTWIGTEPIGERMNALDNSLLGDYHRVAMWEPTFRILTR